MAKVVKKAAPRGQRSYPQEARVFSVNFLPQLLAHDEKCFVPYSDFSKLERKYMQLFKRYKREANHK
jgi:hypothetical protein